MKPSAKEFMLSRQRNNLNDWCYQFSGDFNEKRIQKLMDIFHLEQCADIWRVKGYLKMQDGGIRKIDYVFGDQFLEDRDSFADDKTNKLVIIGKRIDVQWLENNLKHSKMRACESIVGITMR